MKKQYSLDYSIKKDKDRLKAVIDILDTLQTKPKPQDLETMASYILYGKDDNSQNAVERREIKRTNTRYDSYTTKEDKNQSLDQIIEDANNRIELQPIQRSQVLHPRPKIHRPKINKKTGEVVDKGDSDVPGMVELWDSIDRLEKYIPEVMDTYKQYQLKHHLIELRRQQYYLKDSYKPPIHFVKIEQPKTQYVDLNSDSAYWITLDEWRNRVENALHHKISKKLDDYEHTNDKVKWVVCHHTFNWEDPKHVRAFIDYYSLLHTYIYDKLWTDSYTLLLDFDRYCAMANFDEVRTFLLKYHLDHYPYEEIQKLQEKEFGWSYHVNRISVILAREIPQKIADCARRHALILDTPIEEKKQCIRCKRWLPRLPLFFQRDHHCRDKFATMCKECQRQAKIEKGELTKDDRRHKKASMPAMSNGKNT